MKQNKILQALAILVFSISCSENSAENEKQAVIKSDDEFKAVTPPRDISKQSGSPVSDTKYQGADIKQGKKSRGLLGLKRNAIIKQDALEIAQIREEARGNITHPHDDVRFDAVSDLDVTDENDLKLLESALIFDQSALVKEQAAFQIAGGDAALAVPILLKALDDPDVSVVLEVINGLSTMEALDSTKVSEIVSALKRVSENTDDSDIKEAALDALNMME